jgi:DNA-binding CsgD family transcriptional regulator
MAVAKMGRTTRRAAAAKDTPRAIPAEEGVALVDGDFKLIAMTSGAETILCNIDASLGGSNGSASLPADLRNRLNAQGGLNSAPIFVTASGHDYSCRMFELRAWSDPVTQPVLALYFKQERSVVDTVFQVGAEYHLTDREQEALIGMAMGLSSKELAMRMNISPNTVKAFLRLIMIKMGATTRAGVVGKLIDQSGRLPVHGVGR